MKSTEKKEERLKRVDMHDFFLQKIEDAMQEERYIEASWLIYSCFENRYFRTVEKVKKECRYSKGRCKKPKNEMALATKVRCIQHLAEANCECFRKAFADELFNQTLIWIKKRNNLMHNLLQLEEYEDMYNQFKESSEEGFTLLQETYKSCTEFRKIYYSDNYVFEFPEEAMEKCNCKPKK